MSSKLKAESLPAFPNSSIPSTDYADYADINPLIPAFQHSSIPAFQHPSIPAFQHFSISAFLNP
jgi:hypothetical protein